MCTLLMGQCCICSSDSDLCKNKTEQSTSEVNDDISIRSHQSTPSPMASVSRPAVSTVSSNSSIGEFHFVLWYFTIICFAKLDGRYIIIIISNSVTHEWNPSCTANGRVHGNDIVLLFKL